MTGRPVICRRVVVAIVCLAATGSRADDATPWRIWLAQPAGARANLDTLPWADAPLTAAAAETAAADLWRDHVARLRAERGAEMEAGVIQLGDQRMPFTMKRFGTAPAAGHSLWISLHGGGGAPPAVNDQQWKNQQRLYTLPEGLYVVPRAPTDTWDLWHQATIDPFFDRLVENMIALEGVDPDRVYVFGYSAGGDGVYQLAPRLADRWAAAGMMAGHPNETSPLGLRNVPFALQVGGNDAAYGRNRIAGEWEQALGDLRAKDPGGYEHWVRVRAGKGHWMDREDAEALPWMAEHRRRTFPDRVVWQQDDVVRRQQSWLAVDPADIDSRALIIATRDGNSITLDTTTARRVTILLHDGMANLDEPITVRAGDRTLFAGRVERTFRNLAEALAARGDPRVLFPARVTVALAGE